MLVDHRLTRAPAAGSAAGEPTAASRLQRPLQRRCFFQACFVLTWEFWGDILSPIAAAWACTAEEIMM